MLELHSLVNCKHREATRNHKKHPVRLNWLCAIYNEKYCIFIKNFKTEYYNLTDHNSRETSPIYTPIFLSPLTSQLVVKHLQLQHLAHIAMLDKPNCPILPNQMRGRSRYFQILAPSLKNSKIQSFCMSVSSWIKYKVGTKQPASQICSEIKVTTFIDCSHVLYSV